MLVKIKARAVDEGSSRFQDFFFFLGGGGSVQGCGDEGVAGSGTPLLGPCSSFEFRA